MRRNARSLAEIRARITREEMRRRSRVKSVEECACFRPQFDDVMLANTEREINGNNLKCKVKQRENYHLRLNFCKGAKNAPDFEGHGGGNFPSRKSKGAFDLWTHFRPFFRAHSNRGGTFLPVVREKCILTASKEWNMTGPNLLTVFFVLLPGSEGNGRKQKHFPPHFLNMQTKKIKKVDSQGWIWCSHNQLRATNMKPGKWWALISAHMSVKFISN